MEEIAEALGINPAPEALPDPPADEIAPLPEEEGPVTEEDAQAELREQAEKE